MTDIFEGVLVGFDTETTGVDVYDDYTRVVTCSIIMDDPSQNLHKVLNWIMDPEIEIPEGASDVHGITTEIARRDGMNYLEGMSQIAHTLKYVIENNIPLVAQNGGFDATLLRVEFNRIGIDFPDTLWDNMIMLDTLVMDKAIDQFRKGKRILTVISSLYGYDLSNAHSADADVEACLYIMRRMMPKFLAKIKKEFGEEPQSFEELMEIQAAYYRKQAIGLENHFRKTDPNKTLNKSWPFHDKE